MIELCPNNWEENLGKINEYISERNLHHKAEGKRWLVQKFPNNYFL